MTELSFFICLCSVKLIKGKYEKPLLTLTFLGLTLTVIPGFCMGLPERGSISEYRTDKVLLYLFYSFFLSNMKDDEENPSFVDSIDSK
jgi:hypothetical protein